MVITATEFMNSGMPVSTDITDAEIEMAIKTVEQMYVKQMFGEIWPDIVQHPASYNELINGTDTMAGLKMAEHHLVFAYMIYDDMRLTRYHAVVKNDEHSENPGRDELLSIAKHHWEIGMTFVDECANYAGVKKEHRYNNLIFSELL